MSLLHPTCVYVETEVSKICIILTEHVGVLQSHFFAGQISCVTWGHMSDVIQLCMWLCVWPLNPWSCKKCLCLSLSNLLELLEIQYNYNSPMSHKSMMNICIFIEAELPN